MSEKFDINDLAGLVKTPGLIRPEMLKDVVRTRRDLRNLDSDDLGANVTMPDLSRDEVLTLNDYVFGENGGPGYQRALVNRLSGLRMFGPGHQFISVADDAIGLPFVSRPLLRLDDENVQKCPNLFPLYRSRDQSIMSYIRALLDKQWGMENAGRIDFFDPYNAWMTPLTNYCKVSSGFPDLSLNIATSSPGNRQEVYRWIGGILQNNGTFPVRQSYYMSQPKFLPYAFEIWLNYINEVTLGDNGMEPYYQALKQNYQDYDCRIYHIILNRNMRNVEWIFCNASCVPSTYPSGAFSTIDRTGNSLRGQGQDEFDVTFESIAFRYGNVNVAKMFNSTAEFFNPDLKNGVRESKYRPLAFNEYYAAGYTHVYPLIDLNKMTLNYWVKK